jgi:CHAT domain-containing protein
MSPARICACGVIWLVVGAAQLNRPVLGASADLCVGISVAESNVAELLSVADCYQNQGNTAAAIPYLEALNRQPGAPMEPREQLELEGLLASAYLRVGDYRRAYTLLEVGIEHVQTVGQPWLAASLLNDLGRLYVAQDEPLYAIAAFDDALRLVRPNDRALRASIGMNLARALMEQSVSGGLEVRLATAGRDIAVLRDVSLKSRHFLTLGTLYREAQVDLGMPAEWRARAYDAYMSAWKLSTGNSGPLPSFALGYIGALYEDEGRLEPALNYTRKAALAAQRASSAASLYQWQWQSGRILRAQGKAEEAIQAYRLATDTLANIRLDVAERSDRSFHRDVAPLYFELADLLLARTPLLASNEAVQQNLLDVRSTLEQLKVAEVEDYFADQCAVNEDRTHLEQFAGDAAIVYPVVLEDRIEILLSLPGGLTQYTTQVDKQTFNNTIRQLRLALEDPDSEDAYRPHAEKLYAWLIAPLDAALAQAKTRTMVLVPGGALRTVPLAVLHDGERFLIERYAVATSPGLTLTGSGQGSDEPGMMLVNGLTQSVSGYPALPYVAAEIDNIAALYPAQVNRDAAFTAASIESELAEKPYNFVHIATHGQFHSDHRRSFLLTHDELITMDRLENILGLKQYVNQPVDLLFLSACQTAAGDDRAALGLAGVAVKSGAASVVASLWLISDESTAMLVSEFYQQLRNGDGNKAKALQKAQLALMQDEKYSHPNYWAPFLLVGNWL